MLRSNVMPSIQGRSGRPVGRWIIDGVTVIVVIVIGMIMTRAKTDAVETWKYPLHQAASVVQLGLENTARIDQFFVPGGTALEATTVQIGDGNSVLVWQVGADLQTQTWQRGKGHFAFIVQEGVDAFATVAQYGESHVVMVWQDGQYGEIMVLQLGEERGVGVLHNGPVRVRIIQF